MIPRVATPERYQRPMAPATNAVSTGRLPRIGRAVAATWLFIMIIGKSAVDGAYRGHAVAG